MTKAKINGDECRSLLFIRQDQPTIEPCCAIDFLFRRILEKCCAIRWLVWLQCKVNKKKADVITEAESTNKQERYYTNARLALTIILQVMKIIMSL
jgi:hypothetical protein